MLAAELLQRANYSSQILSAKDQINDLLTDAKLGFKSLHQILLLTMSILLTLQSYIAVKHKII